MTGTADRANPFATLDTFQSKPPPKPVDKERIARLAEESGFPSRPATPTRQPETAAAPARRKGRRYMTGRNQQINIKATAQTIERLYQVADRMNVPLGEALELALASLERDQVTLPTSGGR